MSNASVSYTKYYNGTSWIDPGNVSGPLAYGYSPNGSTGVLFGILCTATINVSTGYTVNSITFSIPRIQGTGNFSENGVKIYALLYKSNPQSNFSDYTVAAPWKSGASSNVTISSSSISGTVTVSSLGITSSGTYYVFLTTTATTSSKPIIYQLYQSDQITCSVAHTKNPTPATSITVSPSALYMDTAMKISWTPYTSGYTYKLTYKFVGKTTKAETNIATSISASYRNWTPDSSTLGQYVPDRESGTLTLYLESYLDGSKVGDKISASFTLSIPTSERNPTATSGWFLPSCSPTYTDQNVYISSLSSLSAEIDPGLLSPKYGATISSITISCNGSTVSASTSTKKTYSLGKATSSSGLTTNTVSVTVTDSRGNTLTDHTDFSIRAYTAPYFSKLEVARCDENLNPDPDGHYFSVLANVVYTSFTGNTRTIQSHYKEINGSYNSYTSVTNNTKVLKGSGNLTADKTYVVEVRAYDTVCTSSNAISQTRTVVSTSVVATFNIAPSGVSAAFFDLADKNATRQLKVNGEVLAESMSLTTTPLPIASGGTGGSTNNSALQNLGAFNLRLGTQIVATQADPKNLDDYTTPGVYYSQNSANTTYISNSPTTIGFKLVVMYKSTTAQINQIVFVNSSTDVYIRYNASSTWHAWSKLVSGSPLAIADGGTGATTAAGARNALGLGNTTGALPIANGGTGATTAAQARTNLGISSAGMTFDLLWTDSHFPETIGQYSFAAQTISLSLSSYKMVLIETWTLAQSLGHHILPVPTPSATNQLYNYLTDCFGRIYVRACVVSTTGITFDVGVYYDENRVQQTDNYRVHPCRIWGIK